MPEIQQVLPKYLQIANHIRDQILSGDLRPGEEVPSERTLATAWSVSRPTATKALDALRRQGLVDSRQGSGTYVIDRVPLHRRAHDRYRHARDTGGIYTQGEWAEIVTAEVADLPEEAATALELPVPGSGAWPRCSAPQPFRPRPRCRGQRRLPQFGGRRIDIVRRGQRGIDVRTGR